MKIDNNDDTPLKEWHPELWSPLTYGCPSQWMGVDKKGNEILVRYRWGVLQVWQNQEVAWSRKIGDHYDGILDEERMKGLTGLHLERDCDQHEPPKFDIFQLLDKCSSKCKKCAGTGKMMPPELPGWYRHKSLRDPAGAIDALAEDYPELFESVKPQPTPTENDHPPTK